MRRHRDEVAARRERAARRVAGRGARGRERRGSAALPLPRRLRAPLARADDERDQRRRARRQHGRSPGVHAVPGRRADVLRGAALGRRGVPQAQEAARREGLCDRGRRRGRLRAQPLEQPRGDRARARGDRGRRLSARRRHRDRARPGVERVLQGWQVRARGRRRHPQRRGNDRVLGGVGVALPDRVDRGRARRIGLERLEGAHPEARRAHAAGRRRSVRDEPEDPLAGHRPGRRERDPDQGEPDRNAQRDARGDPARARGGLCGGGVAPLGRDRGHDDRRSRGRHRLRPDQDRLALAVRSRREIQPPARDRGGARRARGVRGPLEARAERQR